MFEGKGGWQRTPVSRRDFEEVQREEEGREFMPRGRWWSFERSREAAYAAPPLLATLRGLALALALGLDFEFLPFGSGVHFVPLRFLSTLVVGETP